MYAGTTTFDDAGERLRGLLWPKFFAELGIKAREKRRIKEHSARILSLAIADSYFKTASVWDKIARYVGEL
jgi:hypothetical protein